MKADLFFRAALVPAFLGLSALAEEVTVLETDFGPGSLDGWHPFHPGTEPSVTLTPDGVLEGTRSDSGGLIALSRTFSQPVERMAIEFSLAVSEGRGRVFHLWTQEPDGTDASQLNLSVQNGRLKQFDGRTRTWENVADIHIAPSKSEGEPVWHRIRAVVDETAMGLDLWISEAGSTALPVEPSATMAAYRSERPISGISFVSGTRIAEDAWYLVDDLMIRAGGGLPAPGEPRPLLEPFPLWSGPDLPEDPEAIPFAEGLEHQVVHRPGPGDDKFLHGAAILAHDGVLYANWANSPVDENSAGESLRGRRSFDGGRTWSDLEIVAPGFPGKDRHSHGVLFVHEDEVWTVCARFGLGEKGRTFPGLQAEAFVLDEESDRWVSRGIVMENCWPYDEPVRMGDGNFITGGQDRDGLPVIAISQGDDLAKMWDTILLPFPPELAPSFAETTVWADGADVLAVIRGGRRTAWVSKSIDHGRTWTKARPANLPMPRAKAYLGELSTGQMFLVSNFRDRNTLVVSTGKPGERTLGRMWRIRHGVSEAPLHPGFAKSPQWSYPYAHEHDDRLWIVYSIGKEECGLTTVPISSLQP